MTDDPRLQRVRRYIAAYNAFDLEGMLEGLHPDVVFRNISDGAVTHETAGLEAFRAQAKAATGLFAERSQTIASVTEADDPAGGLRVGIAYAATLASDLPGGMKAGDRITLTGESLFGFRDGRIALIVDRS